MNVIAITGRLTADIEPKVTTSGKSVCSFSLAVRRPFSEDKTDFINVTAWEKKADFVSKYFKKGDMMAVTGNLEQRTYEVEGKKRSDYYVNAHDINFCGAKTEATKETPAPKETPEPWFEEVAADEDLPF